MSLSIAVSTKAGPRTYWNQWFKERGIFNIEVDFNCTSCPVEPQSVQRAAEYLKPFNMSAHSRCPALIHENKTIETAQQWGFLSEIFIASQLGIKELNFHLPKYVELNNTNYNKIVQFLSAAGKLAREKNVSLILENNWQGNFSGSGDFLRIFDAFPELPVCFDTGHAHIACKGKELEFMESIKTHIRNVHIHDNKGDDDSHLAIGDGNINFAEVLAFLKQKTDAKKLIIENRNEADMQKTLKALSLLGLT